MVAGNTVLRYKDALNDLERHSPGTKTAFLFGYLERARDRHFTADEHDATEVVACGACGQPTGLREPGRGGPLCAFCRTRDRVLAVMDAPGHGAPVGVPT